MGVLAFFFRAILFLFIFRLGGIVLRAFFGGLVQGSRPPGPSTRSGPSARRAASATPRGHIEELVQDPVCGVHTAMSSAIAGRYQGSNAYFCSPECAAKAAAA
ncbi:MAG: hypothetical protein ABI672_13690 [Vicinamibacteria bacterium]